MSPGSPYVEPGQVRKLHFPLRVMTLMDPDIQDLKPLTATGPNVFPILVDISRRWTDLSLLRQMYVDAGEKRIQSLKDGRNNIGCAEGDAERIQIQGEGGQIAVAMATRRKVNREVNVFSAGADVDADEVKTRVSYSDTLRTRVPKGLDMLVFKEKVIRDRLFWLVIGRAPLYWIVGWRMGWEILEFGHNIDIPGRGTSFGFWAREMHLWLPQSLLWIGSFDLGEPLKEPEKPAPWEIGPDIDF